MASSPIPTIEIVTKFRANPLDPNTMYAITGNTIYKYTISTDSWQIIYNNNDLTNTKKLRDIDFHPTNPNIVYFSGNLILQTTNAGATVTNFPIPFSFFANTTLGTDILSGDPNFDCVSTQNPLWFMGTQLWNNNIQNSLFCWVQTPPPVQVDDGYWQLTTLNGNNTATITPNLTTQVVDPKLLNIVSIEEPHKKLYKIKCQVTQPRGTGFSVKLVNLRTGNSELLYSSGISEDNFSGMIESSFVSPNSNLSLNEIYNDYNYYVEITNQVNFNTYLTGTKIIIDDFEVIEKTSEYENYSKVDFCRIAVDTWNPNNIFAFVKYQKANSIHGVSAIEKFSLANQSSITIAEVSTEVGKALPNKIEFEQSVNNQNLFYLGAVTIARAFLPSENHLENKIEYLHNSTVHDDIRDLKVMSEGNDDLVYLGTDGGISKTIIQPTQLNTQNNVNWESKGKGLNIMNFYGIGKSNVQGTLAGGSQDCGTNFLQEGIWSHKNGGDGGDVTFIEGNTPKIFGAYNGSLIESCNNGETWLKPCNDIFNNEFETGYEGYRSFSQNLPLAYIFGAIKISNNVNGVYRTLDGCNFSKISPSSFDNNWLLVYPEAWSKSNPDLAVVNRINVTTNKSEIWKTNAAMASETVAQNPNSWVNITGSLNGLLQNNWVQVSMIAVRPDNSNQILVSIQGYGSTTNGNRIFMSNNEGQTWQNITFNLPDVPIIFIKALEGTSEEIFVGTDVGLFYKNASMSNWEAVNNNLPNVIINDIEIDQNNGKMYLGTFGRGLWESVLPCIPATGNLLLTSENTLWNTEKRITQNIEIATGATLTITSSVLLNENAKIIVRPGAKLIINGGSISVACGYLWEGIIVEGNHAAAQEEQWQGKVVIYNSGTLRYARKAIRSINGGIVSAQYAVIKNCRYGIIIENYHAPYINGIEKRNASRIIGCDFITDEEIRDPQYTTNGIREGGRWFISLQNVSGVKIQNNIFQNNLTLPADLKGNGISTWLASGYIVNNLFENLSYGIQSAGMYNSMDYLNVQNNTFRMVNRGVTESSNALSYIARNSFELPATDQNNIYVNTNYGIYSAACAAFTYEHNTINGNNELESYGIITRNAAFGFCSVNDNQFYSLAKGAQAEDWCIGLDVQCNDFMPDLSIACLVDPEFEPGLWQGFKEQGSSAAQIPQRNQFLNKPINPRFVAHIYSNLEFVYNYDPNNATENPESSSTIVDRFPINNPGIINYCFEVPPNPCSYPCDELIPLINPSEPEASRLAQYWLRSMVDTGNVEELMSAIENNNFTYKEKYLLPIHISLEKSDEANHLLSEQMLNNHVDSSFVFTYTYLEQAYNRSEALDSPNAAGFASLVTVETGDLFYSDLAKNIINHFSETNIHPVPEYWINNPIRPVIDSVTQGIFAKVYPNPLDGDVLSISVHKIASTNPNAKENNLDIEISNALGQRIQTMNVILEKNKSTILFDVPPGLYFVRLYTNDQVFLNQKIIKR